MKECIKCKTEFTPLQHNQKQCSCCYVDELVETKNWGRLDRFFDRLGGYEDRKCNVCNTAFTPTSPQNRICTTCTKVKKKSRHLWGRFRILHTDYDKMLALQDNKCAICNSSVPSEGRDSTYFNVDHDHSTGKVRGLLCTKCNVGLGNFKDNTDLLHKAIDYLIQHRKSNDYPEMEYT